MRCAYTNVYIAINRHCYIPYPKVDLPFRPRYSATNNFTTSSAPILSSQCAAPPNTRYIARGDEAWFINSLLSYNSFTTIITKHTAIVSSSFAMGTFKLHMLLSRDKPPHITPFRVFFFSCFNTNTLFKIEITRQLN